MSGRDTESSSTSCRDWAAMPALLPRPVKSTAPTPTPSSAGRVATMTGPPVTATASARKITAVSGFPSTMAMAAAAPAVPIRASIRPPGESRITRDIQTASP